MSRNREEDDDHKRRSKMAKDCVEQIYAWMLYQSEQRVTHKSYGEMHAVIHWKAGQPTFVKVEEASTLQVGGGENLLRGVDADENKR